MHFQQEFVITHLKSPKSGRDVLNQLSVYSIVQDYVMFMSYGTPIVMCTKNKTYLNEDYWDYSRTTSKYRNIFLHRSTKEIKEKIKSGEYELIKFRK